MQRRKSLIALSAILCFLPFSRAFAGGDLDPDFGAAGEVTTPVGAGDSEVHGMALQSDAEIIVAGSATAAGTSFAFARYMPSGSLDGGFGDSGTLVVPFASGDAEANSIALQGDSIVAAGDVVSSGSSHDFALVRLLSNGTVDSTFGSSGTVLTDFGGDDQANEVLVQSDQKIVAVGYSCAGSNCGFALARYLPDGALDPDFGMGGQVLAFVGTSSLSSTSALGAALDGTGKIVVVGYLGDLSEFAIGRFNGDGSVDASFGSKGLMTGGLSPRAMGNAAFKAKRQPDGGILVGGTTIFFDDSSDGALLRLTPAGSLDANFGTNGVALTNFGLHDGLGTSESQSDRKIIASGTTCASNGLDQCAFAVARYGPSGKPDPSWGSNGILTTVVGGTTSLASSSVVQADDRTVVAGVATVGGRRVFALARYLPGDICGNGILEPGEQCDDGNTADGDCCSSTCQLQDCAILAVKDSFLSSRPANTNEGANPILALRSTGLDRPVVGFDLSHIENLAGFKSAHLVLTIANGLNNWGQKGRMVESHPLLEDFTEGNGESFNLPLPQRTRGTGPGVTWACATDANIADLLTECTMSWNGGNFGPLSDSVLHTNRLVGDVSWDVTQNVHAGTSAWLIKKRDERQSGRVNYYSREGAVAVGNVDLGPRLMLKAE
jgi:uncharacterized delta-60 repeat protein